MAANQPLTGVNYYDPILNSYRVKDMGWNDRINWDLHEELEQSVQEGLLEEGTPAYGITQQVIQQGLASLSPKQRHVYYREVVPALNEMAHRQNVRESCYSAVD
jgi:hypothetical protein